MRPLSKYTRWLKKTDSSDRNRLDPEGTLSSILVVKLECPEERCKCYDYKRKAYWVRRKKLQLSITIFMVLKNIESSFFQFCSRRFNHGFLWIRVSYSVSPPLRPYTSCSQLFISLVCCITMIFVLYILATVSKIHLYHKWGRGFARYSR